MNCPIRVSVAGWGSNVAYTLLCSNVMPYFFSSADNTIQDESRRLSKNWHSGGEKMCCFWENIKKKQR